MNTATKIFAIVLFLLALVLGALAILLARQTPAPPPPAAVPVVELAAPVAAPEVPTVPVVVAARPLAAGRILDRDDLRVAQWRDAPGTGYGAPEAVVGEALRFPLSAGEPVLTGSLVTGLALRLEPGERAVAIPVDDVMGVANRLQPGDWVDVFFTLPRIGADAQRNQSRLLLPRLRVLAYGAESVDGPDPRESRSGSGNNSARTAILAVPLASVNELILAGGNGRLQLALRSPKDEEVPGVDLFPAPARVLAARGDLPAERRHALEDPANVAYAGMDLPALSGPLPLPAVARPRAVAGGGGGSIEIVRGTDIRQEAFR